LQNLRWIAAAALSAYACHLAVHHATPIDRALPFVALALTFLAWLSYSEMMLGVPVLIVAEIAVADETLRLLIFGMVAALAVAVACGAPASSRPPGRHPAGDAGEEPPPGRRHSGGLEAGAPLVAVVALLLLRWIPFESVQLAREIALLAVAVAIVVVLGRTPFAVAVAVIVSLVTTLMPLRTIALPLAVLLAAAVARVFGLPALRLVWPSTVAVAFVMLFFPWSGVVARAFPYFLRRAAAEKPRTIVQQALAPSQSMTYDVPEDATHLIVSGANVAHFRRGAILGRIEPGRTDIRIGDVADWGYLRREAWHKAHNPLPRDAAGKMRDYGYHAWIDGAGRIPLPAGARTIRVTADGALPVNATLQVEGFE
jgi:hypothetical protein